ARALVSRRPFLILDDSLSAVDAETEREILAGLRKVLEGTTAILVSHRLSALQHADQVLVLSERGIVESGTHKELLALGGHYANIYQRQALTGDLS
ncbi:MAG: ABC transporter ATP-binding protein, partial [Pseudomonadota bacterium]